MSAELAAVAVAVEPDPRNWTVNSNVTGDGDDWDVRIEINGYSVEIGIYPEGAQTSPQSLCCLFSPEKARQMASVLLEAYELVKDLPTRI